MECQCPLIPCSKPHPGEEKPGPCREEPPFWWLSRDTERASREPESGDFYTTLTDFKEVEKYDVIGEMKLNDPDEYIPGEIYQSQKPQQTIAASCQPFQGVQWTPKSPDFYKPFDINSVPQADNYLYRMVKKRQQLDLASTLKEDSDYSLKGETKLDSVGRSVHYEEAPLQALPSRSALKQATRLCTEHFFCECHQHHSLPKSTTSSKTTVCEKCGCEYNVLDPSLIDVSTRIMAATSSHIAATNPYCFRDVIGRN
ncbi:hypothetical protein GE061_004942 [Apolygus lucorum]|uniref:Uncharacterized protein n=1 Tax=Apolygus lucorum TaxID=248454 RepID=A0A8S9WWA3_APOLU|nr:hypothetical protein GE061_004942 [Apolygus lucorum]